MAPEDVLVVLSTFPTMETAEAAARTLVGEELAACVNIVPGARSIYRWNGAIETAGEVLAVAKTTRTGYAALAARLVEVHPYDVPEILALSVADGAAGYLAWVGANVTAPRTPGTAPR